MIGPWTSCVTTVATPATRFGFPRLWVSEALRQQHQRRHAIGAVTAPARSRNALRPRAVIPLIYDSAPAAAHAGPGLQAVRGLRHRHANYFLHAGRHVLAPRSDARSDAVLYVSYARAWRWNPALRFGFAAALSSSVRACKNRCHAVVCPRFQSLRVCNPLCAAISGLLLKPL